MSYTHVGTREVYWNKKHGELYFNRETVVELINEFLKEYDLTLSDINEIINTPDIDTQVEYSEIPENQDITYHRCGTILSIYNVKDMEQAFVWFEDMAGRIEALGEADENVLYNGLDTRFNERDNKISMVLKVIQDVSNQIIEKTIEDI